MICQFANNSIRIDKWQGILLLENLATDNLMNPLIPIGSIYDMERIMEFHDQNFNIVHEDDTIISAPPRALSWFDADDYDELMDVLKLANYLQYTDLVVLLLLVMRVKK